MADEKLNGANGENDTNEAGEDNETKKISGAGEASEIKKASGAGVGNKTSEATSKSQNELKMPRSLVMQKRERQAELRKLAELSWEEFKASDEYKLLDKNRNKKGQLVPDNEQLRLLVKHEKIKLNEIDTSKITNMSYLFADISNMDVDFRARDWVGNPQRKDFSGIDKWDTSKVTTFEGMFGSNKDFNEDIGGWDTGSATNFYSMFYYAENFNQPLDKWDTSNATNMKSMFNSASSFNQDINSWVVSNVTTMKHMFYGAENFNQALDKWDTSSVTDMSKMFCEAKNFNQNINDWDVSRVSDFSYMFYYAASFNQSLDKWDTSNAEKKDFMFKGTKWNFEQFKNSAEFKDIKRKNGKYLPNDEQLRVLVASEEIKLSEIDTSEITDMSFLFAELYEDEDIKAYSHKVGNPQRKDFSGIGEWDTSKVTTFEGMFKICREFNENISGWDTSSAKNFKYMFLYSSRFNQPIGKWNTSNATDMSGMFWEAEVFNQDINDWNVSSVNDFSKMFCLAKNFDKPLDRWNTSNATNMKFMFNGADSFNQNINSWDVSRVADFSYMFRNAKNFNQPLDKWDTSNATNMKSMFKDTSSFNQNINSWNVSKVADFSYMFSGNDRDKLFTAFNQPLDKWDVSSAENMSSMFRNARNFEQDLSIWGDKLGKLQNMSFMFDGAKALSIDFLSSWKIPADCRQIGIRNTQRTIDTKGVKSRFAGRASFASLRGSKGMENLADSLWAKNKLSNYSIIELDKSERKYDETWICNDFLQDWLPENIKKEFKVFLARCDEKSGLSKGDKNAWDCAFCEVFEHYFLIEKYNNEASGISGINGKKRVDVVQGRNEDDLLQFDYKKCEFTDFSDGLKIGFEPRNVDNQLFSF